MKTNIFSRMLLIVVAIYSLSVGLLYAQSDPSKEILVYFTSGIDRAPAGQPATVRASTIQHLLTRFNIDSKSLVSAFPNFNEADTLKQLADGRSIGLPNMTRIFKIRIPSGIAREEIIDSLKKLSNVLFAEPNGGVSVDVVPNDQHFSYQWAIQAGGGTGRIQAPEAWDIYQGSSSTKIGIIDEGVDASHPDLSGKVSGSTTLYGYHGTHVAGIAAAKTNNTTGVAGVNWNAQILSEPFNDATSSGDPYLYQIITDAVDQGCDVLNSSWKLLNNDRTPGRYSTTVRLAFTYTYKQNRVAVASMGNTGNTSNTVQYPASFGQGIIAVGATEQSDARASFSTYGSAIDVSAPGVSILSTFRNGSTFSDPNYEYLDGTSMSTPFVTGVASLLKGYNSNLYNDDIEHIIQLSADDKGDLGWDQYYGYGRVNARKALDYLRSPYTLNQWSASGGSVAENVSYSGYFYGLPGAPDGYYLGHRYEVRKNITFPSAFSALTGAWGRGVATSGYDWSPSNTNFTMGYCEIVPGTLTSTTATLRTWVYEISHSDGSYYGWYPTTPSNVSYGYTVLGVHSIINVPSDYTTIDAALSNAISGQTVYVAAGTQNVSSSLTIQNGVTLELAAGAQLVFAEGTSLTIASSGRLLADGASWSQPVTFTAATGTSWEGIIIDHNNTSQLTYCDIYHADYPLTTYSVNTFTVNHLAVSNSDFGWDAALRFYGSSPTLNDVYVSGGQYSYNGIRFAQGSTGSLSVLLDPAEPETV